MEIIEHQLDPQTLERANIKTSFLADNPALVKRLEQARQSRGAGSS